MTTDVRAGVSALLDRYGLPSAATAPLIALVDLVDTDDHAPTSVRGPAAILADHLADSLVALELSQTRGAGAIADIGSGAGFPGLPLAIARTSAEVALVEASARKRDFIARAIKRCGIANATAVWSRAEEWNSGLARFDLVTARALAPLGVVAEYGAPLLRVGGALLVWRGRRDRADEEIAARAAAQLGLEPLDPISVQPYSGAENRHLHLMQKVMETPARFPRRAGLARKRPLGLSRTGNGGV